MVITTQTYADNKKLNDHLFGTMKLAEVTLRTSVGNLADYLPPASTEDLRRFGFDGWALDYIDGPEPVLAMLCDTVNIHRTGISLRDISEAQHNMIVQSNINTFVVGRLHNSTVGRREYGAGAISTTTKNVKPARFWTEGPVDQSARREIEGRIAALRAEFDALKESVRPIRHRLGELRAEREGLMKEAVSKVYTRQESCTYVGCAEKIKRGQRCRAKSVRATGGTSEEDW